MPIEITSAANDPRMTQAHVVALRLGQARDSRQDSLAREEPLELRLRGRTYAVIMRTPGHDELLALGFLLSEGLITSADDIASLTCSNSAKAPGLGGLVEVVPAEGSRFAYDRIEAGRRDLTTSSAGGLSRMQAVDSLLAEVPPLTDGPRLAQKVLSSAVGSLRERQPLFALTGATHGASAHAQDGAVMACHEDVGRHNAVDKVVGAILLSRQKGDPRSPAFLSLSGRIGFELVQKAARARIPILAGVSAPTSLAVSVAERAGLTLAGFVRQGCMNVYTHPWRILDVADDD